MQARPAHQLKMLKLVVHCHSATPEDHRTHAQSAEYKQNISNNEFISQSFSFFIVA